MRVTIEHKQSTSGLIRKKTFYEVHTTIQFTQEEQATIRTRKLGNTTVMERMPGPNTSFYQKDFTMMGDFFDLKIDGLLKSTDVYASATPLDAKQYDENLKNALRTLKGYLEGNAEPVSGSTTFEL